MKDKRIMGIIKNYCIKCDISKKTSVSDKHSDDFRLALKSLLKEKIGFNESEEFVASISKCMLKEKGFSDILNIFNDDIYEMLDFVYPNKFKPWQIKKIKNNYWDNEEHRKNAIKWLVEEKLGIKEDSECKILTRKMFVDYGLGGMLKLYYSNSPTKAIDYVYGDDYKAWELGRVPNKFWKDEKNRVDALVWLFKEKLNVGYSDMHRISMRKVLTENGLGGLAKAYNNHLNEIRKYVIENKILG